MGRRRSSSRNSLKPKKPKHKQGSLMHSHYDEHGYGYHGAVTTTVVNAGPKIIDKVSTKHFGILLSTQKAVEEFQAKSGMKKAFSTEYQYHYWALVARIRVEDEVLDIAIPTVMFNYKQEVSGAAVDFHLNDVEEASQRNAPVAEAIAGVLIESSFAKYLTDTFVNVEWLNVPMNTCHVHPGNMSVFSGTDYKTTINDPGICFPLANPTEQPSFSSIICHGPAADGHIGKVVRTEYRFANKEDQNIVYYHGTCLAYWKGYTIDGYTIPGYKKPLPLIKALFSNKQFDEKADEIVPEKIINAYVNTNGTPVVLQENQLILDIIAQFDALEFSPYTEDILAERIESRKFGYQTTTYNGANKYHNAAEYPLKPEAVRNIKKINGTLTLAALSSALIDAGYAHAHIKNWGWYKLEAQYKALIDEQAKMASKLVNPSVGNQTTTKQPSLIAMREALIKAGYTSSVVYGWVESKVQYMYKQMMDIQERLDKANVVAKDTVEPQSAADLYEQSTEMTIDEKIKFMLVNGITVIEIKGKSTDELEEMFIDLIEEIEEAETIAELNSQSTTDIPLHASEETLVNNPRVIEFLETYGLARDTISLYSEDDLRILLEELAFS